MVILFEERIFENKIVRLILKYCENFNNHEFSWKTVRYPFRDKNLITSIRCTNLPEISEILLKNFSSHPSVEEKWVRAGIFAGAGEFFRKNISHNFEAPLDPCQMTKAVPRRGKLAVFRR